MSEIRASNEWGHIDRALSIGLGFIAVGSGFEKEADAITTYAPCLIPGLLMTNPYMEAHFGQHFAENGFPDAESQITQLIELKEARQDRVVGNRLLGFFIGIDALTTHGGRFTQETIRGAALHLANVAASGQAKIHLVADPQTPVHRELSRDPNAGLVLYHKDQQPFAVTVEAGVDSYHLTTAYHGGQKIESAANGMQTLATSPSVLSVETSLEIIEAAAGRSAT